MEVIVVMVFALKQIQIMIVVRTSFVVKAMAPFAPFAHGAKSVAREGLPTAHVVLK